MEKRIKEIRLALELSVDELSLRTLVPAASIYAYEKGSRKISLEYVQSLLINCAANPIWIMTGQGNMFLDDTYNALNTFAPESLRETLAHAILTANTNNNLDELEQVVIKYDVMANIRTKFVNFNVEQPLWQFLLKGDIEKNC
jgi:transcriptional regulator with XRE-family HTH domain